MAKFTVTYNGQAGGFPSFYSFDPESIIGMNNRLYTFKNGKLYGHESETADRNNFYGEAGESSIQTIFNEQPSDNKIYKTINLEGTDAWDTTLTSDLQTTGSIEKAWYEKLENSYRAFVRDTGGDPTIAEELPMRSMNGIGKTSNVTSFASTSSVFFPIDLKVSANVGDSIYAAAGPSFDTLFYVGAVTNTTFLPTATVPTNNMTIDTSGGTTLGTAEHYIMSAKNSIAESHGVTGHYGVITLTNDSTSAVELFSVEAEVMMSLT